MGGGGGCLPVKGRHEDGNKIVFPCPSNCQVVLHLWKQNSINDVPTLAWKTFKESRKYMKLLNTCTDDYIVRHKALIKMLVRTVDLSLFDLDCEEVPFGLMRPNFNFSLSPSLLFMDGLSFRLMCKPDSYQSSRPNPASVIVSESLKCLQKWNFHPCDGTSDAKCYKPVKGQCWSTGSEAVDMFYFIPHVKNTSICLVLHKPCTTTNTLRP